MSIRPKRVSIIAAMANNRVIGKDNRLPWHLPADLAHFKRITMGKPMLMGRKTWESLPGLLPGRRHVVITRDPAYRAEGADTVNSIDEALAATSEADEVMVVGGANLYGQFLAIADRMYLTRVDTDVEGDAWFPDFDAKYWQEVASESHSADDRNAFDYEFVTLERA
ncbi:MAG: type 3 dihydrofolate reductase [bacterium]